MPSYEPPTSDDFKKLSLLIPKDLHRELKKYALENDKTVTSVLVDLISKLVES
jgi:hypothetical protein